MIPESPQEQRILIAEYVLGLHAPEQEAEIARWLEQDSEAADLARRWQEHWLDAAALLEPVSLPPQLWKRISRRIEGTSGKRPRLWLQLWQSLTVWRALAASLLVAVALLLGPLRQPAPVYTVILQAPGEAANPGWRVTVSDAGELRLTPLMHGSYPADRSVQFWTLADPALGPRSLGLVEPDHPLVLPARRVGGVQSGQLFELTLEPAGGSPGKRPSGPILFMGRAVAL
ncbi:anti-sigma-K factor RskA [Alcanivorax hongdengensis A-11-3]|uniref:Anti-sigma-K factor RskA n=1 Tax=Alcanivorax hongdengensis A-11-3 TaxID=1177179 RepID=L0WFD6_9GAMM|nr:anti-sigma factor [Alcanivorax hongdengensis]EKF75751.1 anti-sigma-K factor RskA [Alcanivorax hongdengensis A-11-3]